MKLLIGLFLIVLFASCEKETWCVTCINANTTATEKYCSESESNCDNWQQERENRGKVAHQTVICQKVKQ